MMAADKTSKPGGAQPKRHSEVSVIPQRVGQFFDGEVAMDLELASGQTIRGAEEGDLAYIEGEDYAILSDGSLFIQCAVKQGSPSRYFIEYQDGSKDKHYQAVDEQIALDRVLSAFRKYLGRDPSWRTDFQWEKLKLEASSTAHSAMASQTVGVLAAHHPSDVGQIRRMPAVIAEFPSEEFHTSLQAIEAAFERIRAKEYAGRTILLSGQSYEAGGEQYRMIDVLYEDGTFKFKHPVAEIELVARFARIPPERVTVWRTDARGYH